MRKGDPEQGRDYRELVDRGHTFINYFDECLVTLTTENDMRVKASDRCRVIRVRSEIFISQLLLVL